MKLRYRYAIISFCTDLTDSDARSVPTAALLLGRADGLGVAAVTAREHPLPHLDPVSSALLSDLLHLIKEHVDETFDAVEGVIDIDDVLHRLEQSLRNSLHVSSISEELEVEIRDENEASSTAVSAVVRAFQDALREERGRDEGEPPYLLEPPAGFFPPVQAWPLPLLRSRDSVPAS